MNLVKLTKIKQVPAGQKLIDRMGKDELAANLFRITQTDLKIKNEGLQGQYKLERAAEEVGQKVRKTMIELSGTSPEDLPIAEPIRDVKKALKDTNKKFRNLDKPKITQAR